jgi:hypothetical protein
MPDTTARALLDQLGVDIDKLDTALRGLLAPDDNGTGGDPHADAFTALLPAPEGSIMPDSSS